MISPAVAEKRDSVGADVSASAAAAAADVSAAAAAESTTEQELLARLVQILQRWCCTSYLIK